MLYSADNVLTPKALQEVSSHTKSFPRESYFYLQSTPEIRTGRKTAFSPDQWSRLSNFECLYLFNCFVQANVLCRACISWKHNINSWNMETGGLMKHGYWLVHHPHILNNCALSPVGLGHFFYLPFVWKCNTHFQMQIIINYVNSELIK